MYLALFLNMPILQLIKHAQKEDQTAPYRQTTLSFPCRGIDTANSVSINHQGSVSLQITLACSL